MICKNGIQYDIVVVGQGTEYAVVGRVQDVGEGGGLEDETAEVRPHC